ncbi:hypothetical protein [Azospirillum sp. Marseille-Q6669]
MALLLGIGNVWRPLGQVQAAPGIAPWGMSHASYPTVLPLDGERVRVFFSTRDAQQRSSIAALDLGLEGDRFEVLGAPRGPLLSPGPRGAFDADGVTVGCVLRHDGRTYVFYLGWTVLQRVPFTNFIGLAVGEDDGALIRVSPVPIVGRSRENPFTLGYPWVIRDGIGWRMWFGSHLAWGDTGLQMTHVIKEARSVDLTTWTPGDRTVIDIAGADDPDEFAVSRPSVIREPDGSLSMWYARRRPDYALGFARSADGATWKRDDAAIRFQGAPEPWESRERTYPCVFDHAGHRYMLYNGNGYGREGFGLAIQEERR